MDPNSHLQLRERINAVMSEPELVAPQWFDGQPVLDVCLGDEPGRVCIRSAPGWKFEREAMLNAGFKSVAFGDWKSTIDVQNLVPVVLMLKAQGFALRSGCMSVNQADALWATALGKPGFRSKLDPEAQAFLDTFPEEEEESLAQ